MKYLPRAGSALSFQNPHISPGRDSKQRSNDVYKHRVQAAQNRGFSGPLMSLVPIEARANNRAKKERTESQGNGGGFDSDVDEPRSPKVSCIGQIKQKKKLHKLKREKSKKQEEARIVEVWENAKKKPSFSFENIFRRKGSKKSALAAGTAPVVAAPPGLNQMKRFSSGRDAFANFDWTKQVAPVDFDKGRECFSDDDEQRRRDWDEDEEEEEDRGGRSDIIIPFSGPLMIGGGSGVGDVIILEPRKEINLWKKRNMAPPPPLKLNSFR